MADVKIDVVGATDLPLVSELYNQVFKPAHDVEFFKRRFLGRYNPLIMVAVTDGHPVGFYLGFELKPSVFFTWLYGVLPNFRRQSIASQLLDAAHAWSGEHEYQVVRVECHNQHRPTLHLCIKQMYDIVGIRWDADHASNLVIFEKTLDSH